MLTVEKNKKILDKRISSLKLKGKIIIAFDFDELVVPLHLTREITKIISNPIDQAKLQKLRSNSFEGILYLNQLFYGYDYEQYLKIVKEKSISIPFTKGFDELIKKLSKKYSIIFISSGLKDVCDEKLKQIKFDTNNTLGDELITKKGKIVGTKMVISDELKGYIVQKLKENHKVISIGHSMGDKFMLKNSDLSISVNSGISGLANVEVSDLQEVLPIIEKFSNS